jgi:hypothetical protein
MDFTAEGRRGDKRGEWEEEVSRKGAKAQRVGEGWWVAGGGVAGGGWRERGQQRIGPRTSGARTPVAAAIDRY